MKKAYWLISGLAVFVLAAQMPVRAQEVNPSPTAAASLSPAGLPLVNLSFKGITITAEVANEPSALQKGLMFRHSLGKDSGMLFVFPDSSPRAFWMKNTEIPLSIAFIDEKGKVLDIQEMAPMTETIHGCKEPVKFALEMNIGWFAANGAQPGDRIPGVLEAPPAETTPDHPPYSLDKDQMAWGKAQFEKMLKDRPNMAKYVREGDGLWDWTVRQFAGEWEKGGIEWDPSDPVPLWDGRYYAEGAGRKARVQVTALSAIKSYHFGQPKSGPDLWYDLIFELCNFQMLEKTYAVNALAKAAKIDVEEYCYRKTWVEGVGTAQAVHNVYMAYWVPNCRELNLEPWDDFMKTMKLDGIPVPSNRKFWSNYFSPDYSKPRQGNIRDEDFVFHRLFYQKQYEDEMLPWLKMMDIPAPTPVPMDELKKKLEAELPPVAPTPTVSAGDEKAMDSVPPPP
jgi:uncharacterized protein